jgi:hypothetical protein
MGEILALRCTHVCLVPAAPGPEPSSSSLCFEARLDIHQSKRNKTGPPERLPIPFYGPHSTPMLLHAYLAAYRTRFASSFPFSEKDFLFPSWSRPVSSRLPLRRAELGRALFTFFPSSPSDHSGYSFRSGGATDLADLQVPHQLIKTLGRWKSDAYLLYIRVNPQRDARSLSQAYASLLSRSSWSAPGCQISHTGPAGPDLPRSRPATTSLAVLEPFEPSSLSPLASGQVDGDISSPNDDSI